MSSESKSEESAGIGAWALRGISRLFAAMPLPRALAVGRALGGFFGGVIRYHRADAQDALANALGVALGLSTALSPWRDALLRWSGGRG